MEGGDWSLTIETSVSHLLASPLSLSVCVPDIPSFSASLSCIWAMLFFYFWLSRESCERREVEAASGGGVLYVSSRDTGLPSVLMHGCLSVRSGKRRDELANCFIEGYS